MTYAFKLWPFLPLLLAPFPFLSTFVSRSRTTLLDKSLQRTTAVRSLFYHLFRLSFMYASTINSPSPAPPRSPLLEVAHMCRVFKTALRLVEEGTTASIVFESRSVSFSLLFACFSLLSESGGIAVYARHDPRFSVNPSFISLLVFSYLPPLILDDIPPRGRKPLSLSLAD